MSLLLSAATNGQPYARAYLGRIGTVIRSMVAHYAIVARCPVQYS